MLGLAGWATARAVPEEIDALRKSPVLPLDRDLPPSYLKNSDDQTVLSLSVLGRAMRSLGEPSASYREWGIVAAPVFFGRWGTFQSLVSYRQDGAWGITPHMIPHHSLHAVSGTISQALGIHGPNFGVGGGASAAGEAFLAAATMISENVLPGLWVVLSGHEPECVPKTKNADGQTAGACLAAALALKPPGSAEFPSCFRVSGGDPPRDWPMLTLSDFMQALEMAVPGGCWALSGSGWVRLGDRNGEKDLC
jgi:hypothetical protein